MGINNTEEVEPPEEGKYSILSLYTQQYFEFIKKPSNFID